MGVNDCQHLSFQIHFDVRITNFRRHGGPGSARRLKISDRRPSGRRPPFNCFRQVQRSLFHPRLFFRMLFCLPGLTFEYGEVKENYC